MNSHQEIYAPLFLPAVALVSGIVLGKMIDMDLSLFFLLGILGITLLVAWLLQRWSRWQTGLIFFGCIILGILLVQRELQSRHFEVPKGFVYQEVVVSSAPVVRGKTLAMDIINVHDGNKMKCHIMRDTQSERLTVGSGFACYSEIEPLFYPSYDYVGKTFVRHRYWFRKQLSLKELSIIERSRLFFNKKRALLLNHYKNKGLKDKEYALIAAMTLGDKSAIDKELKEDYSVSGASHVLALSGLHLGIIYAVIFLFMGRWRHYVMAQLFILICIWAYVFMVGMSASVVRSAIMLSLYSILTMGYRDHRSVNVLSFCAIIMVIFNPLYVFDIGFELSFMAVLAILTWYPLFNRLTYIRYLKKNRFVYKIWQMIGVSLAAQIGTAPLVVYYFHRFSCYFLFTNLFVIPLATVILYLAVVFLFLMFCHPVQQLLINILGYIASMMNTGVQYIAALRGACIDALYPTMLQVSMMYVIIVCLYLMLCYLVPSEQEG